MPESNRGMIENGRAKFAYDTVSEYIKTLDESKKEKYRTRIITMPMMIKTNGFGTTMAFYSSKRNNDEYEAVYNQIQKWLEEEEYLSNGQKLIEKITSTTIDEYKLMTNETMALLAWMKRFVEGLVEVEKKSKNSHNELEKNDGNIEKGNGE